MSKYRIKNIHHTADVFGALSNPNRLQLFLRLLQYCYPGKRIQGEPETCACVGELSEGLGLAASTVSHHIKELKRVGLIQTGRKGQHVECWIDPETIQEIAHFFEGCDSK